MQSVYRPLAPAPPGGPPDHSGSEPRKRKKKARIACNHCRLKRVGVSRPESYLVLALPYLSTRVVPVVRKQVRTLTACHSATELDPTVLVACGPVCRASICVTTQMLPPRWPSKARWKPSNADCRSTPTSLRLFATHQTTKS